MDPYLARSIWAKSYRIRGLALRGLVSGAVISFSPLFFVFLVVAALLY
jgi:hypothetical protein